MFKQAHEDTLAGLESAIGVYSDVFRSLEKEENGQDNVVTYRQTAERCLRATDEAMMPLLLEQENSDPLLVNWAARMDSARRNLDTLDKNLAFKGKRQWSWDEVVHAIAYLEAVIKGAKATLQENNIDFA